jgi:DNA-nicking Smr family endonuclease
VVTNGVLLLVGIKERIYMNLPFKKLLKKLLKKKVKVESISSTEIDEIEDDSKNFNLSQESVVDEANVLEESQETLGEPQGKIREMSDRELEDHFLGDRTDAKASVESTDFADEDTDEEIKIDADGEYFVKNFDKYMSGGEKEDSDSTPHKNRRRKKRQNQPGATLDLHGKTSSVALSRLKSFIGSSRRSNIHMVLVVTGKGIHSPDGKSVLRNSVETWLNNEGRKMISSYKNAPAKLGGSGAIVITLKRR